MTCPDCKGSKVYTPLVGPVERCKGCGGLGQVLEGQSNMTDSEILRVQQRHFWEGIRWDLFTKLSKKETCE